VVYGGKGKGKGKGKLCLCLINHYAIKANGEVDV
jgi:hypothetical protein